MAVTPAALLRDGGTGIDCMGAGCEVETGAEGAASCRWMEGMGAGIAARLASVHLARAATLSGALLAAASTAA